MRVELDEVRARLSERGEAATPVAVAEALGWLGHVVSDASVWATVSALRRDSTGAGPLEPLLREPGVTDVLVNGAGAVYVDRGAGLERAEVEFESEEAVRAWRQHPEHIAAQKQARAMYFASYRIHVCELLREATFEADQTADARA